MQYAIISDIHGNLDALEAVLQSIQERQVDHIVCLGDVVGYGPQPSECLRTLQNINCTVIAGNHDVAVVDKSDSLNFNLYAREATLWTREQLDESDLSFLAELPLVSQLDGFTAVHGTLHTPELFDYVQTSYDAHLSMQEMQQPLCVIGHSHVPIIFVQDEVTTYQLGSSVQVHPGRKTIVNVGSVGQPRDHDPRSCFALYDTDTQILELERVHYNIESVAAKINQAGLPKPLGDRLRKGQ